MSKTIHMADKINQDGGVSALCFASPKPINLKLATWTNRPGAVTCGKCLRAARAKAGA
jgi:hypothetical protein